MDCGWSQTSSFHSATLGKSDANAYILTYLVFIRPVTRIVEEEYLQEGRKMFWKFDLHPSSAIDTMLTREVSLYACVFTQSYIGVSS